MEYPVLVGITLLCYGWLGHHERIMRSLRRLWHVGVTRRDWRI
jgi:hypothetical protein